MKLRVVAEGRSIQVSRSSADCEIANTAPAAPDPYGCQGFDLAGQRTELLAMPDNRNSAEGQQMSFLRKAVRYFGNVARGSSSFQNFTVRRQLVVIAVMHFGQQLCQHFVG